jgi:high affinity sulfate transporter 1
MRHPAQWSRWLPGLQTLATYQVSWLRHDLFAGLVLTAMLVPVGIAYASASGLPGICGLYATIVPLLAYAIFGPSRILVLGPDSALAPVILGVLLPLSAANSTRAVALAGTMAIGSGVVCLVAGLARIGFITELLSKPIRYGYMNGIALTVLLSQIPKLLGLSTDAKGPLQQVFAVTQQVLAGPTNLVVFALGAGTLVLILLLKRFLRVPGVLFAVVVATVLVAVLHLDARAGVAVLGSLPHGLPKPSLPLIPLRDLVPVLTGSLAVALVSFADTSVLSRTYAARLHSPVDPNQELLALGVANFAAGFFQGFPISSSSSRTPVAEAAGAQTQLATITAAAAIALLLVLAPELLHYLPNTALAAVVIAAAIGLFEVSGLVRIYRMQRWEFWLSMVCFAGVMLFGAIPGITIAIILAVIEFLWDGWRPYSAVLGRVNGVGGYHDIARHPEASVLPGLVMLRWDAPLFFANAEQFQTRAREALASAPFPVRWLVVAAEPVTSVDVTSADALGELDDELRAANVQLYFAEMKDPVKDKLRRFQLFTRFEHRFFATLDEAVSAYLTEFRAEWSARPAAAR